MKYGKVVKIRADAMGRYGRALASAGRFMVVGPVVRSDEHAGPMVTAVCLVPPSTAWATGEVGGIWIFQCEEVK